MFGGQALRDAIIAGLNDPPVKAKLLDLGFEIVGNTPEQFTAFQLQEFNRWKKVIDTANVKWARRAVWAPSIVRKDGWYYIFFGANDIQNDRETGGIGVAKSRLIGETAVLPLVGRHLTIVADDYVKPDFVHILINGKIVREGGSELADELEEKGYEFVREERRRRALGPV